MAISHKCQYALRAVFELAKQSGQGPVNVASIAEAQAIPPRFLENILNQLKQSGIVESRRGKAGGYLLSRNPRELTMGEVIRLVEGPIDVVACNGPEGAGCSLNGICVFLPVWERARQALESVYDNVTFEDLVIQERQRLNAQAPMYAI